MLDIKYIRENADIIKKAAVDKLINVDVDRLLEVDKEIREINYRLDELKEKRNKLSKLIPTLSNEDKQNSINEVKSLKYFWNGKQNNSFKRRIY